MMYTVYVTSSQIEDIKCSSPVNASSGSLRVDPSDSVCLTTRLKSPERIDKLPNISPVDSLSNFADSLVTNLPTSSPSVTLVPAVSSPSLYQYANCAVLSQDVPEEETDNVNGTLIASKSTPNLEEIADDDDTMVTNKLSSYYLQGSSSSGKMGSNQNRTDKKYWSQLSASEDSFNQTDYAHHLRSSSYQILHSRQLSSGPCHSRQLSNTSNYSEGDEGGCREDAVFNNSYHQSSHNVADRSRCFSFDNLGYDGGSHSLSWNISEPDLSLAPPVSTSLCSLSPKYDQSQISPSNTSVPLLSKRSSNSCKLSPSPPPPPVRDASSLKYIRYGPGHEKFPSWPVPAGSSLVIPQASQIHDSSISSVADHPSCNYLSPQGSQRSHSWTEQSEYPKERCGGYVRPSHKKQFSPSFQKQLLTVMEKCEKISPEVFKSRHPDDILKAPCYSFIDNYLHQTSCYPPFDREGRAIDDKDYSIPSPPERDPGMGESHISEMTSAQLEEHTLIFLMPIFHRSLLCLINLDKESYTWDGSSERDSGRGESESVTDSRYSSNGRESVTTVVTNSSSASSSETLKWHGSLSDVSVLSSQSRETKGDHNIVHSARVQAPQRQNSESVQYYSVNGRGKHFNKFYDARIGREGNYPKPYREGKWSREVERNNEVNNLKKFPSYSYTQPLSQINEAPLAESRESLSSSPRSPKGSSVDFNKPPSVAERISELERQSNFNTNTMSAFNWPRTSNDFRDAVHFRDEQYHSLGAGLDMTQESDPKKTSDREPKADSLPSRPDVNLEYSQNQFQSPSSPVSLSFHHSRIPKRRDSEESVLSSDSFGESEKTSFSTSYTYLDPEKRCKVSDATLKNIQKQALLSFYERRTGKCYNGASPSSSSSSSSVASPISGSDSIHPEWTGRSLRKEKGAKPCTGLAKLGRVPTSDKVGGERNTEGERYCSKAIRRRSVNGRDVREGNPTESSALPDLYLPKPIKTNVRSRFRLSKFFKF
ncbi:hypothetical protein Avbf_07187 [Armadillidium vulgare]|nr:hypothetical protein Avbf_07187 [Armadillidium vulgare]